MDSRRQQKVASLIKEEFSNILIREGRNIYGKAFVTVTNVKVTPDLGSARFSLSVFNGDKHEVLAAFNDKRSELKRKLGEKIRFNLRIVPELEFYLDESLDDVFHMEELLRKIKEQDKEIKRDDTQ
ncbi:MAG: 30S ribosome-binding factor RbfA [Bacteroidetes bacterium]|nr:30S ribosome-binding factor RbfA [Bacteroidota bacterium]